MTASFSVIFASKSSSWPKSSMSLRNRFVEVSTLLSRRASSSTHAFESGGGRSRCSECKITEARVECRGFLFELRLLRQQLEPPLLDLVALRGRRFEQCRELRGLALDEP